MGVNISKIIPKKEIDIKELKGKTLAVDGYNILYQFLTTIKDYQTGEPFKNSKGDVTSHISGLFYRCSSLMHAGIRLAFVFDGERPGLKEETVKLRTERKNEALKKLEIAREEGDLEAINRYSSAKHRLTENMLDDAKELLDAMGIPWVQAPSEGEAQAARIVSRGDAYAVMSQDADTLLFGAPRLVRNISVTGRRKLPGRNVWTDISPEKIELDEVLDELGITREQLIIMSMLVGTDYNPSGIKGIGPSKALKLVKEKKTLDTVLEDVDWNFSCDPHKVFDMFINPDVTDNYDIKEKRYDRDRLHRLMIEKHEFSKERTENTIRKLDEIDRRKNQKSLFSWKS